MGTTEQSDARLEVHVLSGIKGESIALRLPDGAWGLVDCFAVAGQSAPLAFLRSRNVRSLEFLCLTHPHEDHFRGMSEVLEAIPVRSFWRPAAMTGETLKMLVNAVRIDAARSKVRDFIESANELQTIYATLKELRKDSKQPAIRKHGALGQQLFPVPADVNAECQIWAIAPSGRQLDNYESALRRCFTDGGQLRDAFPDAHHNVISMALLVIFGDTRIILGGDVETAGWQDVLVEFGRNQLAAHAVKVSHHGSTNGYCEELWECFARDRKPLAVVAPYRHHRLPRQQALEHIREFAEAILTTCVHGIRGRELPTPLSRTAPLKSRIAIKKAFNAFQGGKPECGICSLSFDARGNCIECKTQEPAAELPMFSGS